MKKPRPIYNAILNPKETAPGATLPRQGRGRRDLRLKAIAERLAAKRTRGKR